MENWIKLVWKRKFGSDESLQKFLTKSLSVIALTGMIGFTGMAAIPQNAYAALSYTDNISEANPLSGQSSGVTFSTTINANTTVLKKVVLQIPSGYTVNTPVPSQIGSLQLTVPSLGTLSNSVNNGQTIQIYQGNTNDYTYEVTLDATAKTITVSAGTGTRKVFPDSLEMTFTTPAPRLLWHISP